MTTEPVGRVVGLQRSSGGVPKLAVESAEVRLTGMVGDRQANRRFHGGPTRALCLYSRERIDALIAEGHPMAPGVAGENVTIAGVPWDAVAPGVLLEVGEVTMQVTSYTSPCSKIAGGFRDGVFTRIAQKVNPGWSRVYVSIVREGSIAVGDPVRLLGAKS